LGGAFLLAFGLTLALGLLPVNRGFQPDPAGIEVAFASDAFHADVILPVDAPTANWRDRLQSEYFSGDTSRATHVAFGWGERGFFAGNPGGFWSTSLGVARALLLPTPSCLRVVMLRSDALPVGARSVRVTPEQYARLVAYLEASFRRNRGALELIPGAARADNDAFFEARGRYHALNTCNTWVGRAMRSAGLPTGRLTPLPKTALWYLPEAA